MKPQRVFRSADNKKLVWTANKLEDKLGIQMNFTNGKADEKHRMFIQQGQRQGSAPKQE